MTVPYVDGQVLAALASQRVTAAAQGISGQLDRRTQQLSRDSVGLRQVQVASRNPATLTCQVYLDGDTTSPVPCGLLSPAAVPVVGAWGWALHNGTDLLLVGTAAGLPKVKLRSTATNTVTTEETWVFGAGTIQYDTDYDGTVGMWDSASGGIVIRWPGKYAFGARGFVTPSADNIEPVARIRVNGVTYLDGWQDRSRGTAAMHFTIHNEREFAAGDVFTLRISSGVGSSVFGTSSNELGMAMWASYLP